MQRNVELVAAGLVAEDIGGTMSDWAEKVWTLFSLACPSPPAKPMGCREARVLCSGAGAETKPQTTATSKHSSHNVKEPKLENSKEKCHIIKYSLIRTPRISV